MTHRTDKYTPTQRAEIEQAISDLMNAASSAGSAGARGDSLGLALQRETQAYKRLWSMLFLEDDTDG